MIVFAVAIIWVFKGESMWHNSISGVSDFRPLKIICPAPRPTLKPFSPYSPPSLCLKAKMIFCNGCEKRFKIRNFAKRWVLGEWIGGSWSLVAKIGPLFYSIYKVFCSVRCSPMTDYVAFVVRSFLMLHQYPKLHCRLFITHVYIPYSRIILSLCANITTRDDLVFERGGKCHLCKNNEVESVASWVTWHNQPGASWRVIHLGICSQEMAQNLRRVCLPIELYRSIAREVESKHDLCSLARASQTLQAEAERYLNRSLSLRRVHDIVVIGRRIFSTPTVAEYVRVPRIRGHHGRYKDIIWASIHNILRSVLCVLTNLRDLDIIMPAPFRHYAGETYFKLFENCSFRLHRFCANFGIDGRLIEFFENQPEIRDLELVHFQMDLPPHILPNVCILRTFSITESVARFLSDRHISHLQLHSISANTLPHFFADAAKSITALSTGPYMSNHLPSILPHLELLAGMFNPKLVDLVRLR
jgi:hypothetical protein